MKKLLFLGSFVLLLVFSSACSNKKMLHTNINAEDFYDTIKKEQDITVVDVRTPNEYSDGHIANAINIDYESDTFKEELEKLDKEKPVYIYCSSGNRSSEALEHFNALGFKKIYQLEHGITDWEDKELPIHKH